LACRVFAKKLLAHVSRAVHGGRPSLCVPKQRRKAMDEQNLPANKQKGGIGYVLLWILGVPIPVLILIALVRGCT
jgi:hypothetical protein